MAHVTWLNWGQRTPPPQASQQNGGNETMCDRKPVGVCWNSTLNAVQVVCDDGAVFFYFDNEGQWRELPPVPGTEAEGPYAEALEAVRLEAVKDAEHDTPEGGSEG